MTQKTLKYWFESSPDSMIRINCWFRWPFCAFSQFRRHFCGISLNFLDLFGISWLNWPSRNWLRINSWLKWIPQALIQIGSWLKVLPHFFISRYDSSDLILSRLMLRLWIIPMSDSWSFWVAYTTVTFDLTFHFARPGNGCVICPG